MMMILKEFPNLVFRSPLPLDGDNAKLLLFNKRVLPAVPVVTLVIGSEEDKKVNKQNQAEGLEAAEQTSGTQFD